MSQNPAPRRHFGEQVAALIQEQGLTLRDASEQAAIPLTTLHRRLNAESLSFTLGELTRLAAVLGTTASALVSQYEGNAA